MTDDPAREMMDDLVKEVARLLRAHRDQAVIIEKEQNLSSEYAIKIRALEQAVSDATALIKRRDGHIETLEGRILNQYGIIQERNKRIAELEATVKQLQDRMP